MMFARTPDGVRFATLEASSPDEPFSPYVLNLNRNSKNQNIITISEIFVFLRPKTTAMRIISKKTLVKYYTAHPQSKLMLEDWYEKTKKANWKNFADIRATFNTVSSVGNQRYVFNIKGNDYRLVVIIKFHPSHVLIRFVGTHAEYDRIANITSI